MKACFRRIEDFLYCYMQNITTTGQTYHVENMQDLIWLAYPCRYGEMIPSFGRSVSDFSLVFNSLMAEVPIIYFEALVMKKLKCCFLFIIVQNCWCFTKHVV